MHQRHAAGEKPGRKRSGELGSSISCGICRSVAGDANGATKAWLSWAPLRALAPAAGAPARSTSTTS